MKLRFPGGRYHATPWGHHVNEGLIEWPPSPWRLLRALIACGFSSQGWSEVPETARQLIDKLAGVLPSYQLPEASAAHSRHYMPLGAFKKPPASSRSSYQFSATTTQRADLYNYFTEDTTLVFDTWANVGSGELFIRWPCELAEEETDLLGQLSAALGYLGRSESWVEAELVADREMNPKDFNAYPWREGTNPGVDFEQVSLMAAIPPEEYREWQQKQTEAALALLPLPEGKRKPRKTLIAKRDKAVQPFPPDLLECLTKDTVWWKGHGWSQPPGSQRVLYWRKRDALQVGVPRTVRKRGVAPVEMMLLAVTTPSGNRSALPPVQRTLPQAELFHRAVISKAANGEEINCPSLTGKDEYDRPRKDHRHAHTLPIDLDGDGRIDHIVVYAEMGLCDTAQRAIRTLWRTWTKGGVGDLQLAVIGHGKLDTLRDLPDKLRANAESLLGPRGSARIWESVTPFVPPRYLKKYGRNTLAGQVKAELASRDLPEAVEVQHDPDLTRKLRHHIRHRSHGRNQPPMNVGFGLRLEFESPQSGPILLGYASHYGLGMFRAVVE